MPERRTDGESILRNTFAPGVGRRTRLSLAVLGHEPQRQCAGCGRRAAQAELVRLTLKRDDVPPSVVAVDGGQHSGRSAYVCPKRGCFDRALQRKAFNRAFRQTVVVDVDGIVAVLEKGSTVAQENDTAGG